jgi:hypothetical protein
MEKRKDPRFRTQFDALFTTGPAEGAGMLVDLSYSGAHIDHASLRPEVGMLVRLYVFVQPVAPFQIEGRVTRATERGFAIAYSIDDAEVRRLVDDVSAIVTTPS